MDSTDINKSGGADTPTNVEEENDSVWSKPKRSPTLKEQRTMFGKALEIMLITCMNNHAYQFENVVRLQSQGGPTGLKLTEGIAD